MNIRLTRTCAVAALAALPLALAACQSQSVVGVTDWNDHAMELDPVKNIVPVSDGTDMVDVSEVDRHDVGRWEFLWKPLPTEDGQGDMPAEEASADAGAGAGE